jgi:glutathione S-transferase
MIAIYGRATSSNVQLAMWTVGELGIEHERLDYGGAFGKTDTPEYAAMNPMRLVPVLKDGTLTMFESAAIMRYLSAAYGDDTFWPRDPRARAGLDQWAEWGKLTFAGGMMPVFIGIVRTPPSKFDPASIAPAVANVAKLAKILDARLGAGPWLAGETFTFGDLGVGSYLYRYYTLDFERAETPALDAYYARLQERPAFRRHVMVSFDSLRAKD